MTLYTRPPSRPSGAYFIIVIVYIILFGIIVNGCRTTNSGMDDLIVQAESGNALAQYDLGQLYYGGVGVDQDYDQAFKWFDLAANQGFAEAQLLLGFFYSNGFGVQRDYDNAYYWLTLASARGLDEAVALRAKISNFLTQDQIQAAEQRAQNANPSIVEYSESIEALIDNASNGSVDAQLNLGMCYYLGGCYGLGQEYEKANKWFSLAAEQGSSKAQNYLGIMYSNGYGVEQDYRQASYWYMAAAQQGNPEAQLNLSALYINGRGVPQDFLEAYVWVNLSASAGEESAIEVRDSLIRYLTPEQLAEGQRRSREYQAQ